MVLLMMMIMMIVWIIREIGCSGISRELLLGSEELIDVMEVEEIWVLIIGCVYDWGEGKKMKIN